MSTLKERFEKAYPLANYEAVYARFMRDNKDKFNEAMWCYEQGVALEPFVMVEKVGKTYFDKYDVIEYIRSTSTREQVIGYDLESDLFYVFPEKLVLVYPTLESYVEDLISHLICSTKTV